MPDEDILKDVMEEVDGLTDEQLEDEAKKIMASQEKRREYNKTRVQSPEAKAKQVEYRQKKYARDKAIIEKYKAMYPEEEA